MLIIHSLNHATLRSLFAMTRLFLQSPPESARIHLIAERIPFLFLGAGPSLCLFLCLYKAKQNLAMSDTQFTQPEHDHAAVPSRSIFLCLKLYTRKSWCARAGLRMFSASKVHHFSRMLWPKLHVGNSVTRGPPIRKRQKKNVTLAVIRDGSQIFYNFLGSASQKLWL